MAEAVAGLRFVLQTIGFNPAETGSIMEAGLSEFEDFRYLVEKDIRDMEEEFGKRTMVQGRIVFRLGRTKKLTGVMHWVQDRFRASDVPDHFDFNEPALYEALSLAQIWNSDIDLVDTNTKAANPGKFKDECKWPEWEKSFINYLSVIPGVSRIPLSYIVCDEEFPAAGLVYATFNDRMVNRAPLT
jgi:hypothetical protein